LHCLLLNLIENQPQNRCLLPWLKHCCAAACLQAYTFKKKLEGGMKRLTAPAASISAVAPSYYASRFRKFMAQVFN
jgi:hypothetical protein